MCPCVPVDCDGGGWVLGTDAPHAVSHINGHLACIYLLFISLVGWVFVWFMSDGHRQLVAAVRVVCDVWFAAAVACLGEFVLGADDLQLHANCDTEADHQNQQRQVGGNGGLLCCLPDAAVAGDCRRLQAGAGSLHRRGWYYVTGMPESKSRERGEPTNDATPVTRHGAGEGQTLKFKCLPELRSH